MYAHLSCVDNDHPVAAIDARIKLLAAFAVLVMVISNSGFVFPLGVAICSLALCAWMRMPLRTLFFRFSEPLFIVTIVVILKAFFSAAPNATELFSLSLPGFSLTAYREGLFEGLIIASRIIGAVSVVGVMGYSMPFTEFTSGLVWFKLPKGFIEILTFTYRYIFVLFEEAQVIYLAQKNRLGYSSMTRGMRSFGALVGSLIIKAFDHSQNTTVAMVQRGYDGTLPVRPHKSLRFGEILGSSMALAVLGVIWKIS